MSAGTQQTETIKRLRKELDQAEDTIRHLEQTVIAMREQIDQQEFEHLDQLQFQKRTARRERENLKQTITELRAQLDQFIEPKKSAH